MSEGGLKKLVIKGYKDEKFETEIADGEFTTLVNPEKYMVAYKPEYKEESEYIMNTAAQFEV